jgi:putative flippase GtrA
MKSFSTLWFLVRYGLVGVSGGVLQTATLYVWVELLHLQDLYLLGAVVGFCIALFVTFTLQKYWTFKDRTVKDTHRQFILYTCIALVNLALNVLLLHVGKTFLEALGLNFFHIWYLLTQVVIIGALAAASFIANYFLTFKNRPSVEIGQ